MGKTASVKTHIICLAECSRKAEVHEIKLQQKDGEKNVMKDILDISGNVIKVWQYTNGTCGNDACKRYLTKLGGLNEYEHINKQLKQTDVFINSPHLTPDAYISSIKLVVSEKKVVIKANALKRTAETSKMPTVSQESYLDNQFEAVEKLQDEVGGIDDRKEKIQKRMDNILNSSGKRPRPHSAKSPHSAKKPVVEPVTVSDDDEKEEDDDENEKEENDDENEKEDEDDDEENDPDYKRPRNAMEE